jgi:tryptophan synthase beta chain
MHQTVIGLEAEKQMEELGAVPDTVVGCVGGGSNFAGIAYPFLPDRLRGESEMRFVAVEPAACPTLTKGRFAYDFGDTAKLTPLLPMYTLGHDFVPAPVHAGGLRYHGGSPSMSLLVKEGFVEARAYPQGPVFAAAMQFAQTQGIVPAPESAHAIRAAIDEALEAREEGRDRVILFNLSGHGHFDMQAYDDYQNQRLAEVEFDDQDLALSMASVPEVPIG